MRIGLSVNIMHEGIFHGHAYGKLTLDDLVGSRRKTHEGLLNRIDNKRKRPCEQGC